MVKVEVDDIVLKPFHLLDVEWALLVAGRERPNPMTVSWGGFGTLWRRPVVTVYVRPTRYTFSLLGTHAEFTLNFLPEPYRSALDSCGSSSGRDVDKWERTGLNRFPSERIEVPRVAEAHLAFECRTLATVDFDPKRFLDTGIEELYPARDYHRVFFGEVLAAWKGSNPGT